CRQLTQLVIELRAPCVVGFLTLQERVDAPLDLRDRGFLRGERSARRNQLLTLLVDERRGEQVRIARDHLQRLSRLAGGNELRGLCTHAPLRELLDAREDRAV